MIFQNRAGLLTFGAIVSHSMSDVEYLSPTEPVVVNNKAIEAQSTSNIPCQIDNILRQIMIFFPPETKDSPQIFQTWSFSGL